MKMRETVSVAGNATIIEDCPYCGRLCGTGYAQVIFTHGRFLRRDSASAMSFQGIVTDVEKCHTVSNWESKALISNISQSCRGIFFLSDRDSLPRMSSAEGATHGGCERTSMPSPIRWCRNVSCERNVMVNHVHSSRHRLADLDLSCLHMGPLVGPCDSANYKCSACNATLAQVPSLTS